jgi:hypothetical protein
MTLLVFWIKRLLPVASGTTFVNLEHNQEVKLGLRADAWEPSVRVGTLAVVRRHFSI